jgi:uncharacterized membrane protein
MAQSKDYQINLKAELEIMHLLGRVDQKPGSDLITGNKANADR